MIVFFELIEISRNKNERTARLTEEFKGKNDGETGEKDIHAVVFFCFYVLECLTLRRHCYGQTLIPNITRIF